MNCNGIASYLPAGEHAPVAAVEAQPHPPSRGQETILLAEDESAVRLPVIKLLEAAGYRVLAADDGLQALRILEQQQQVVHLALLDVVMPGLGGPETFERMRKHHADLRVVFTTGYADVRHLERLPPDAEVLEKPYRSEELLDRIRRELDR